ncbi:MAG: hypothetical protein V3T86_05215 [Planctomycetota bacterium]
MLRGLASLLALTALVAAEEWPYPEGSSTHTIEGLKVAIMRPETLSREKPASLAIILHGNGGDSQIVHSISECVERGYIVVGPKSTGMGWNGADVKAVLRIAAHLKKVLPIDPDKVHVLGFSNGGWNLGGLAFDDELKPCSATWIGAGYRGARVPKWAKKHLGVLALAGAQDPNANAAQKTVPMLRDKVRSAECRLQDDLGHKWPTALMSYLQWWMDTNEGRFTPGVDENFAWTDELEEAQTKVAGGKRGGVLVYFWDKADAENPQAKLLSNSVLMDPAVRHYGGQLRAIKFERTIFTIEAEKYGVKTTPALVVLNTKGAVKKKIEGKFKPRSVAKALRSVAPNRRPPE